MISPEYETPTKEEYVPLEFTNENLVKLIKQIFKNQLTVLEAKVYKEQLKHTQYVLGDVLHLDGDLLGIYVYVMIMRHEEILLRDIIILATYMILTDYIQYGKCRVHEFLTTEPSLTYMQRKINLSHVSNINILAWDVRDPNARLPNIACALYKDSTYNNIYEDVVKHSFLFLGLVYWKCFKPYNDATYVY